jgi:hypothetical protein
MVISLNFYIWFLGKMIFPAMSKIAKVGLKTTRKFSGQGALHTMVIGQVGKGFQQCDW